MPTVRITDETMQALRGAAIYEFRQTGIRQADGTWVVEISEDTAARLAEFAQRGETLDDTVQRIICHRRGDRPN